MFDSFKNYRALLLILAAAVATVGIIFLLFGTDSNVNNNNLQFIRSYGWEVSEKPEEIVRLTIPEEFDLVYETYHSLEKEAGFDLSSHKGKPATRYTYRVYNHQDSDHGLIRANVFVTRDGIIAADICSLEMGGFLQPISDTKGQVNQ